MALSYYKPWMLRVATHKFYFDTGWGALSYFKYLLGVLGIGGLLVGFSIKWVFLIGVIYGVICYVLGRWMVVHGFSAAEIEVRNLINKFVGETRKFIKLNKRNKNDK